MTGNEIVVILRTIFTQGPPSAQPKHSLFIQIKCLLNNWLLLVAALMMVMCSSKVTGEFVVKVTAESLMNLIFPVLVF